MLPLAELEVRHTRRHQPTRRVAIPYARLPMDGGQYGAVLLGCLVAATVDGLLDEQVQAIPAFLAEARSGTITIPGMADTTGRAAGWGTLAGAAVGVLFPPSLIGGAVFGGAAGAIAGRRRNRSIRAIADAISNPAA